MPKWKFASAQDEGWCTLRTQSLSETGGLFSLNMLPVTGQIQRALQNATEGQRLQKYFRLILNVRLSRTVFEV